jgi:hypothetical protein
VLSRRDRLARRRACPTRQQHGRIGPLVCPPSNTGSKGLNRVRCSPPQGNKGTPHDGPRLSMPASVRHPVVGEPRLNCKGRGGNGCGGSLAGVFCCAIFETRTASASWGAPAKHQAGFHFGGQDQIRPVRQCSERPGSILLQRTKFVRWFASRYVQAALALQAQGRTTSTQQGCESAYASCDF